MMRRRPSKRVAATRRLAWWLVALALAAGLAGCGGGGSGASAASGAESGEEAAVGAPEEGQAELKKLEAEFKKREAVEEAEAKKNLEAADRAAKVAATLRGIGVEQVTLIDVAPQYEVKIKSVGLLSVADRFELIEEDPERPSLVAEAYRGDELVGAVVFNRNRAIIGCQRRLAEDLTARPTP